MTMEGDVEHLLAEIQETFVKKLRKAAYMPSLLQELEPIARLLSLVRRLRDAGFHVILASKMPFKPASHPYPPKVWQAFSILGSLTNVYQINSSYYIPIIGGIFAKIEGEEQEPFELRPTRLEKINSYELRVYTIDSLKEPLEYMRRSFSAYQLTQYLPSIEELMVFEEIYLTKAAAFSHPDLVQIYNPVLLSLFGHHSFYVRDKLGLNSQQVTFLSEKLLQEILWPENLWIGSLGRIAVVDRDAVGNLIQLSTRSPIDVLAAARLLSLRGVVFHYNFIQPLNKYGLVIHLRTRYPLNSRYLVLFPRKFLHLEIRPARIVSEGSRVVLVDDDAIQSLQTGT
ncbi:MAG: hypothetical protein QXS96_07445 [Candidatus Caldarchaeum sp.]